jgi:hypothetical protein
MLLVLVWHDFKALQEMGECNEAWKGRGGSTIKSKSKGVGELLRIGMSKHSSGKLEYVRKAYVLI